MEKILYKENVNSCYISLTGYRTLFIFELLLSGPKSIEEIKLALLQNKYIQEELSEDTIKNYINSLIDAGCSIDRAFNKTGYKFVMGNHPLKFTITKPQIKALKKVSKIISENGSIQDVENFENFIIKLITYTDDEIIRDYLLGFLIINKQNSLIYKEIKRCCNQKRCSRIEYKSAGIGKQIIEVYCDNLFIKSNNLYFGGYTLNHNTYSTFLLKRVKKILKINNNPIKFYTETKDVICEIYDINYIPDDRDYIIEKYPNKLIVKFDNKDNFRTCQKILLLGDKCKVLQPKTIQKKIIKTIKEMRKIYEKY